MLNWKKTSPACRSSKQVAQHAQWTGLTPSAKGLAHSSTRIDSAYNDYSLTSFLHSLEHSSGRGPRPSSPSLTLFTQSQQVNWTEWIENDNKAETWLPPNAFPFRNSLLFIPPWQMASPDTITDKKGRSIRTTVSWESGKTHHYWVSKLRRYTKVAQPIATGLSGYRKCCSWCIWTKFSHPEGGDSTSPRPTRCTLVNLYAASIQCSVVATRLHAVPAHWISVGVWEGQHAFYKQPYYIHLVQRY